MVLCLWQPVDRSEDEPRVCVLTAGNPGSTARLEGAGELREAVDETDHHQVEPQVDAPEEVPFRVVSDPREGHAARVRMRVILMGIIDLRLARRSHSERCC